MAGRSDLAAAEDLVLLPRQNGCVQCLDTTPKCPTCADGEVCQVTVPLNCTECPKAYCIASSTSTSSSSSSTSSAPAVSSSSSSSSSGGHSDAGAIAGGVVGGVVAIAIITYLVWRFCIRNKRKEYEQENWQPDPERTKEGTAGDFTSMASQRQSTHSVRSVASTVLTRASNIIQIAYIPGVTNRAPTTPTVLVPPVPPIPAAHSQNGGAADDQHFFVPGNLRDSTYSGISNFSDRASYAPRSSVASTIYGKNAVISPVPAQKGTLLKPSIISVKSKGTNHSGGSTPPVPTVDHGKYVEPPSPAFSIGSTFFKKANASTATAIRPQMIKVGSGVKKVDIKSTSSGTSPNPSIEERPDEEAEASAQEEGSSTPAKDSAVKTTNDIPPPEESPFADPPKSPESPKSPTKKGNKSASSLSAVAGGTPIPATEEDKRASTASEREHSPFGDEHAVKE